MAILLKDKNGNTITRPISHPATDAQVKAQLEALSNEGKLDSSDVDALFVDASLDTVVDHVKSGLAKFKIDGKSVTFQDSYSKGVQYNRIDMAQMGYTFGAGLLFDVPTTQGTLVCKDSNQNIISSVSVPKLYYNFKGNTLLSDILTESYLERHFGDYFCLNKSDWGLGEATVEDSSTNDGSKIHTFKIPSKCFGTHLPKKYAKTDTNIIINQYVCSWGMKSYLDLMAWNFPSMYIQGMATYYQEEADVDGNSDYYVITFKTPSKIDSASRIYSLSKPYIKFELENPIKIYNVDKLYVKSGCTINYIPDKTKYYNADMVTTYLADSPIPKSITISCAKNNSAVNENMLQVSTNMNDLNDRVVNIEVSSKKIATGDGVTDDSDAIQYALDSSLNIDGTYNDVVLPSGIYCLSKPLNMTKEHMTLRGNGEVILKPTGYFPAITINASYCTVDNLTIELKKYTGSTAEENNGWHCGIYNYEKIVYYTELTNLIIRGHYNYDNMNVENSYGIFFEASAWLGDSVTGNVMNYFGNVDNCKLFYTTVGLCSGAQPCRANLVLEGNKYGIKAVSGCGFYNFVGQSIGFDTHYTTNDAGETVSVNLSKATVLCTGKHNYFLGYNFDPQRTDHQYIFEEKSGYNRYYSPVLQSWLGNNNHLAPNYHLNNDANRQEVTYYDNKVVDKGYENICMFPMEQQINPPIGHDFIKNGYQFARVQMNGIQDNVLAYADKWANVSCFTINSDKSKNLLAPNNNADIRDVFDPNGGNSGFMKGINFDNVETDNPMFIEIDLTSNPLYHCARIGMIFNKIPKTYGIALHLLSGIWTNTLNAYTDAEDVPYYIYCKDNINFDPSITIEKFGIEIDKIRIVLADAFSTDTYNIDSKIGISYIWAIDSNRGGRSYLPSGGGTLYGDIQYNGVNAFEKIANLETRLAALENR